MVRRKWIKPAIMMLPVILSLGEGRMAQAQPSRPPSEKPGAERLPEPLSPVERGGRQATIPLPVTVSPPTILAPDSQPIDLNTALRLAGVQNPEFNVARQRVLESVAIRQLAAAQFLPSINP